MRTILFLSLILLLTRCSSQTGTASNDYYFPLNKLLEGKSYHYVNPADSTDQTVWKLKSGISGKDTILETIIYNNGEMAEEMTELVRQGNSKFVTYNLYRDGNMARCSITDSAIFERNQQLNKSIQWSISFKDPTTNDSVNLSKTRELQSMDNKRKIFLDHMEVRLPEKSVLYTYSILSTYEMGTGLVEYKITRSNGQVRDFKLAKID